VGGAIFFRGRVFFLQASFFSANNSIPVLLFFCSKENGGKPRWIFTPPYTISLFCNKFSFAMK
jgi:hypothetical protein